MKLEDVTEKIVRIIKKVESCEWSDRSRACSKDCPLWNLTEPGECCDSLQYLKNEKNQRIQRTYNKYIPRGISRRDERTVR